MDPLDAATADVQSTVALYTELGAECDQQSTIVGRRFIALAIAIVNNRQIVVACLATVDMPWPNFLEFGTTFQREVTLFLQTP